MSQDLKAMKICKGCGAVLQTENKDALGYVKDLSYDYCLSCFNLKHYNIDDDIILKTHFPEVPKNALVVYIISALHLNALFKYDLNKFYPTQKIIVLINKIDLLPKTVNFDLWVQKIKQDSDHLSLLEVMPISALKGSYLNIFLETLNHYKPKQVYFVGFQNSGKSTLLNKIAAKEEKQEVALTAQKPGLTKENITFMYNGFKIIDTPGIYEKGYISDFLSYDHYKNIIPAKRFRPATYQLSSGQSIIIGGVAIISFIKGFKTSFTFYLGNINLHRTKYENVYHVFDKHQGTLFKPTIDAPYEKRYIRLKDNEKYLINIFDIGYLVVKGDITLEMYCPKESNILMVKGAYHGL